MTQTPYRPRREQRPDGVTTPPGRGAEARSRPEDLRGRLDWAAAEAARCGLDGILATPGPDLYYLCGYAPQSDADWFTALVVAAGQFPTLVVPRRDERAAATTPVAGLLDVLPWDGDSPYRRLIDVLDPAGIYAVSDTAWARHLVGIERIAPGVVFQPLSEALPMLRALKDEGEVARLECAAAAVEAAFEQVIRVRFAGRAERAVADDVADCLIAQGHIGVTADVGAGPNAADPFHRSGHRPIQFGDAVVLSIGGLVDGYRSDLTRTVSVGPPDVDLRRIHAAVERAQQTAVEATRPGVPAQEIARIARRILTDGGHRDAVAYCAGHGVGLTADEPPWLTGAGKRPLDAGMCFSVTPGFHLPGRLGVRLGDVVAVTRTGGRRLTRAEHELAVVY